MHRLVAQRVAVGVAERVRRERIAERRAHRRRLVGDFVRHHREDVDGGVVGDGGDAVLAGGEGGDIVAGEVLQGVGIVAARGVGVGDDDGLAAGDGGDIDLTFVANARNDAGDRNGIAVGGDLEGGGKGQVGLLHFLGERESDPGSGRVGFGAGQRGRGGVGAEHGSA